MRAARSEELIGRTGERARLEQAVVDARAGRSRAVLLRGEAGIGKSRLLAYAAERARGLRILRVTPVEAESQLAFAGLAALLEPALSLLDAIPAPQAAALAGALGMGPSARPDRFTVCAGTLSLLAAAAEERPLLVAVDDAHLLDAPSAEALSFTARRIEADAICLLLALRDGEDSPLAAAELEELRVGGLPDDDARAVLERAAGVVVAPAVARRLVAATAGNPLALLELPGLLSPEELAGHEPLPDPLPVGRSVQRAFLRRVRALPAGTRRLLTLAAASGGDVDVVARAGAALGVPASELEPAEEERVVRVRSGRVEFEHPLLRAAVYQAAGTAERREVHAALAEALAEDDEDRRAWHLAASAAGTDEAVAAAVEHVALRARARGGYAAAAIAWERAARLSIVDREHGRRLAEAAWDHHRAGDLDRAVELIGHALALDPDEATWASTQRLRGRVESWRGRPAVAADLLERAADSVTETCPGTAAMLLADAAMPCMLSGQVARALTVAERARELAEVAGDERIRIAAAVHVGCALIAHGRSTEGVPLVLLAEHALDDAPDPLLIGRAGACLTWAEELDEARRLLSRLVDAARAGSAPGLLPYVLSTLGELDFRSGRWAAAYANANEAVRLADEINQPTGRSFTLAYLARIEAAQGRADDCRAHARESLELAGPLGSTAAEVFALAALGLLELGIGDVGRAAERLAHVARLCAEGGLIEPSAVQAAPDLAEALIRDGRREEAERVVDDLESRARLARRSWARAAVCRLRGMLAPDEEIDAPFQQALAWHAATQTPFERARTQLAYGERLRGAGRRTDARPQLSAALRAFEALGAAPWAERARRELAATGEPARRAEPAVVERLSPQELQVALIIAGGATNREAAAQLLLSPKTIEAHLGRAYQKLGVRSRVELARLLLREGVAGERD